MEIFKLFGSIFVENDGANKALDTTGKKADGFASKLGSAIKVAAKVGAAVVAGAAAAGTALFAMTTKAAQAGDRVDKLSQKIGLSREGFQQWDFILSQSGAQIESLQVGMKTLTARMDEASRGTGKGAELFDRLGVSAEDATGKLRSQESVFRDTVSALQNMPDGAEKSRLAFELFGKAGLELMPLLNGAAGSVDEMMKKAQELGLVLSDDTIDASVKFTDTMDQAKRALGAVATQVGAAVMPIFQKLAEWVFANLPAIREVTANVFGAIGKVVSWLAENVIPALHAAWVWLSDNVIPIVLKFWEVITALWDKYGAWILAGLKATWEQVSTILQTAFGIITGLFDFFLSVLSGDWEGAWNAIKGIVETVWNGILTFFGNIWENILVVFKKPIDTIQGWIDGLFGWIDDLIEKARGAIDWVKGLIGLNKEAKDTLPTDEVGETVKLVNVPSFDTGGTVPGPVGEPRLVIAHGGEEIKTPAQQAAVRDIYVTATYTVTDQRTAQAANDDLIDRLRNLGVAVG